MKTIVTTIAIAALALLGAAPQAEARSRSSRIYISGYRSCGTPIYTERFVVGYDHCGRPIWGTRVVRTHYRPVVRERYAAPCPPPYYGHDRDYHRGYDRHHRRNGFSIEGTFYR